MDPLSISVAITALIATIHKLATYVEHLGQAPAHFARLHRDVQGLKYELEILHPQLKNPRVSKHLPVDYVAHVLEAARTTIEELDATLWRCWGESGDGLELKKFRWLKCERKCEQLRLRLEGDMKRLRRLNRSVLV
jgi:hypothetical protein